MTERRGDLEGEEGWRGQSPSHELVLSHISNQIQRQTRIITTDDSWKSDILYYNPQSIVTNYNN